MKELTLKEALKITDKLFDYVATHGNYHDGLYLSEDEKAAWKIIKQEINNK